MDIVHVHFEVVIPCKLLMAKLAFCQWTIGIMSHLVSDQHFLQAKSQVTNLEKTQRYQSYYIEKSEDTPSYHLYKIQYANSYYQVYTERHKNKSALEINGT